MPNLKSELRFLRSLTALNLASSMEYRASFISQIVFMFINNGIMLAFWYLLFTQFGTIRGYGINDIFMLFAVVGFGFGIGYMFAGNTGANLAYIIAQGRLDYYLVLPRPVMLHVIFSRMNVSTIGDTFFGLVAFFVVAGVDGLSWLLFFAATIPAGLIFMGFATAAGSLAFYLGSAQYVSQELTNSVTMFALYPNSLFSGFPRLILFTLIPAGFIGAVPVEIIRDRQFLLLFVLWGAVGVIWLVASSLFYVGLRRYESGSALNVNV